MTWIYTQLPAAPGRPFLQFEVFQQTARQNCGPSSIIMLLRYSDRACLSIGQAQQWCGQAEHMDIPQANLLYARWASNTFEEDPTYDDAIERALNSKFPGLVVRVPSNADLWIALNNATMTNPVLCGVVWGDGTGHYVVCVAHIGNWFIFADPYYGIVASPIVGGGVGPVIYDTLTNSFGRPPAQGNLNFALRT